MILDCYFTSPIARTEHADYVREVTVEIRAFNEGAGEDYLVGKIALSQVLWNDAVADGESLFEICDNDSGGLCEVFTVICDEEEKLRPELEIEDVFDYVVFIYNVVLHPDVQPHAKAILDPVADLFGHSVLVVTWRGIGALPDSDFAALGFRRVVDTELIYRQSAFESDFGRKFPRGEEVDIDGRPDMEQWVEERWKQR